MSKVNPEQLKAIEEVVAFLRRRLRDLRISSGQTAQSVADKLGVGHSRVSDTESGRFDPKLSTILRMLSALDADLIDLVRGAPAIPQLPPEKLSSNGSYPKTCFSGAPHVAVLTSVTTIGGLSVEVKCSVCEAIGKIESCEEFLQWQATIRIM